MTCGNLNYRPEPTGRESTHELSYEERELVRNTRNMFGLLELVYRRRGMSRMSVDGRDSHEGYHMELMDWFRGLEDLGKRLNAEAYGPPEVCGVPPPITDEDIARADEANRISRECGRGIPS